MAALAAATGDGTIDLSARSGRILLGSKFDFKVELEGKVAADAIKVTINGRDAAAALGKPPAIEVDEEGLGHTAPIGYAMFF